MRLEEIPIEKIAPNPAQPRESFPKESIEELAESIKAQGLLQPIAVRGMGSTFQIIAGERRWRACSRLGMKTIPAVVWDVKEDIEVAEKSLIENWDREDLTSVERENMVGYLWDSGRYKTQRELADRLGKTERAIGQNLDAWRFRKEKTVAASVSTRSIADTSGLPEEDRAHILKKVEKGEITPEEVREYKRTFQQAPEPVKEAIKSGKVSLERAKPRIEAGIPEEYAEDLAEELEREEKEEKHQREIEEREDIAVLHGELKAKRVEEKEVKSLDEKKLQKFKDAYDLVRAWLPVHVEEIKYEPYRDEAIDCIKKIESCCRDLLVRLGERKT